MAGQNQARQSATARDRQHQGRRLQANVYRHDDTDPAETIESIRDIADRVVLVTTGEGQVGSDLPVDATLSTAWSDDFAAFRNAGLQDLAADWLLWLDAGETMSEEQALTLRDFLDRGTAAGGADEQHAYLLMIRSPAEEESGAEQVGQLRLVPARDDLHFTARVRESPQPSAEQAGLRIEALSIALDHPADWHEAERRTARAQRLLRVANQDIQDAGPDARNLLAAAEAMQTLGQDEEAAGCFRSAIQKSVRGSTEMLEAYYGLLSCVHRGQSEVSHVIQVAIEALEIFPLDAQLLCAMGGYLQTRGRIDLAVRSYETAYRHGQVNPEATHVADPVMVAARCYALSLAVQGKDDDAKAVLEEVLALRPDSITLRRQLIDLHVKHGDGDAALAAVDMLPPEMRGKEALRSAVRGASLAVAENFVAAMPFLRTAYKAGCRDPLCLRWLCVALLGVGERDEASQVVAAWRELDPKAAEVPQFERLLSESKADTAQAPETPPEDDQRSVRIDLGGPTHGGAKSPSPDGVRESSDRNASSE